MLLTGLVVFGFVLAIQLGFVWVALYLGWILLCGILFGLSSQRRE